MLEIALECKPDETLIKILGYNRKMITHQPNMGQVINYLEKNPGAIGIVDEDPGSANPSYFSKFQKEARGHFDVECFHIPKRGTRLVVIKPRLEEWILKHTAISDVDLQKYSLPGDPRKLHKIINTRLAKFENVVKEMLNRDSKALLHLREVIDGH